jgi:hypothetical protein
MGEELVNRENRRSTRQRRQAVERVAVPIQWSLIAAALVALVQIARDWSLAELGILEIILLMGIAVLCSLPMFQWYREGMNWIPLGEIYVLMHLIYYVFPCLCGRQDWLVYPETQRILVLLAVGLFLITFLVTYRVFFRSSDSALLRSTFLRREANWGTMWALFSLWLTWSFLSQSNLLPNLGQSINVFRSLITAAGSVSVIFLFYQLGQKRLFPNQGLFMVGGFVLGMAANFASGFLNGATELLGAALLAFTLGRKQVPVRTLAFSIVMLAVLHLGKGDYRNAYWSEGANYSEQRIGMVAGYETWFKAAWHNFQQGNDPGTQKNAILERTSLVHILGQVMDDTPNRLPFLMGQTYGMIPELMVPRVFWAGKPRGTLPSETLGIYYGVQTVEGADFTGISIGPLAEAWANFGWIGVVAAGAFCGMLFGLPAMLTRTLQPNQVGWLFASIFLIYCINLENCLPEMLCSLATALVMGTIMLLGISREALMTRPARQRRGVVMNTEQRQRNLKAESGNGEEV